MNRNKMANCNRPTTNWDFKRNKVSAGDGEIESLWDSCIGDESQSDKSAGDIVSIRCRRHKKRFNVERLWLDTCKWLCPRCYEKLTIGERLKYAPKGDVVEIRSKEIGKPVVYAREKVDKESECVCTSRGIEPIESALSDRVHTRQVKETEKTVPISSPELMALIPDWRMECQKCGKVVPVHKMYIDNTSSVICPDCLSRMTPWEIREFHKEHPASKANISRVRYSRCYTPQTINRTSQSNKPVLPLSNGDSSDIAAGGCYSNSTIMSMSVKELAKAVRLGKVSKARARIEMGRRRNTNYFGSLPDVTPVAPILPR